LYLIISFVWQLWGWEKIDLSEGWITIQRGAGNITFDPLFRRPYYLGSIQELEISKEAYYWSDPEFRSLNTACGETRRHIGVGLGALFPSRRVGEQFDLATN
jgi:hypothetical protein